MDTMAEEGTVSECQQTLLSLSDSPIVNFTGLTNTDLKLMYGAPNIDLLMRYDQNYTTLACTLQKWADKLYGEGYVAEARQNQGHSFEKKGVDTLKLARKFLPDAESRKLEYLCGYYGIVSTAHRALAISLSASFLVSLSTSHSIAILCLLSNLYNRSF